jgi:hypothetical protein
MPNKNAWLYFLQEFRKKTKLKGPAVMRAAAKVYKKKQPPTTKKSRPRKRRKS